MVGVHPISAPRHLLDGALIQLVTMVDRVDPAVTSGPAPAMVECTATRAPAACTAATKSAMAPIW
jgi:hypothetical protein